MSVIQAYIGKGTRAYIVLMWVPKVIDRLKAQAQLREFKKTGPYVGWECMDCIHLSQGKEKSRALVDTVIQHWVLKMQERS